MSKQGEKYLINRDDQSLIPSSPIFVLCDSCYWCATFVDKTKIPADNVCPHCGANNNELTSFPVASNESFTVNHNKKRGLEFEFKPRPKRSKL
jgi:hypothetical protein